MHFVHTVERGSTVFIYNMFWMDDDMDDNLKNSANTFATAQHRPGTTNNTLVSWQRVLHKPTALMMSSENDFMAVPMSSMLIEYLRVLKQASSKC